MRIAPSCKGHDSRATFAEREDAARVGLVRYWTETGRWPDFCFEPDLPYDCKAEAAKLKAAGRVR